MGTVTATSWLTCGFIEWMKSFDLREVIPLQLETVERRGQCTRGVTFKKIHGMGTRRYLLSVENDNEFRSP